MSQKIQQGISVVSSIPPSIDLRLGLASINQQTPFLHTAPRGSSGRLAAWNSYDLLSAGRTGSTHPLPPNSINNRDLMAL
ncbi:hypothetical protein WJX75_005006 [Coccomyxa subellipsoidea]|uniref:Uncharacterized protein n=1 Tax=Coccomyxa subellipsoidea TaxID=248742 RepID=A0ABR2YI04_9CHLO